MDIWNDKESLEQIRQSCPGLTKPEFDNYVALGKTTGLNPFKKEIWCVKYASSAAQIFIGRDGYRRVALSHPDYDYHQLDAVYENDDFKVVSGEIHHTYSLKDRGKLVGAYCITKRRSASRAIYHFVKLAEYNSGKSLWVSKPETMIKKVAEAHALRASFHDVLGGTYIPEEMPEEMSEQQSHTQEAKKISEIAPTATPVMIRKIYDMIAEKNISKDRIQKMMAHYKVKTLAGLNTVQAEDLLDKLEKIKAIVEEASTEQTEIITQQEEGSFDAS